MKKNRYPVLAAILALAGAAVFSPKAVLAAEGEKISQGVYIGDVDVSGMTEEEAKQAVEDSMDETKAVSITLKADSEEG